MEVKKNFGPLCIFPPPLLSRVLTPCLAKLVYPTHENKTCDDHEEEDSFILQNFRCFSAKLLKLQCSLFSIMHWMILFPLCSVIYSGKIPILTTLEPKDRGRNIYIWFILTLWICLITFSLGWLHTRKFPHNFSHSPNPRYLNYILQEGGHCRRGGPAGLGAINQSFA